MKANGYPDRRQPKPSTANHAPKGRFSLCGAYFAPVPAEDGTIPVVTCKRCILALNGEARKLRLSAP